MKTNRPTQHHLVRYEKTEETFGPTPNKKIKRDGLGAQGNWDK